MKNYTLIYKDEKPYLREVNPIENNGRLISKETWAEHEQMFENEAKPVLNHVQGRRHYEATELELIWRFTEDGGETYLETTEPNFIGTDIAQYEQVFKVRRKTDAPYQERVREWVSDTFSEEVLFDVMERCFRFVEEAIELGQSLGMSREDMYRQITYTYGRPPGDPTQEIGGVMVTVNAMATAIGVDLLQAAETELSRNIKNASAIREKWLNKTAVSPLK